jgi:hypothetical protein
MSLVIPRGYTDGSGVQSVGRVQSALTSDFPKEIDINIDIVKPEVASTFQRQVVSALRSRGLFAFLEYAEPTLDDLAAANPGVSAEALLQKHTALQAAFQEYDNKVADLLPNLVKWSSLSQSEQEGVNDMTRRGDGRALYAWLMAVTDLKKGRAQDRIRSAFVTTKVAANYSGAQLASAVEAKWWLYRQNTLSLLA